MDTGHSKVDTCRNDPESGEDDDGSLPASDCPGPATLGWLHDAAALRRESAAWTALVRRVPGATVFQTMGWTAAALADPGGRVVRVAVVRGGDRLLAALPLTVGREWLDGVPLRTARIAGHPLTDRCVPLVDPSRPELLGTLLDAALTLDIDALLLTELPDTEPLAGSVRRWLAGRGATAFSRLASEVRLVPVTADTPQALEAGWSANLRSNARRSRRRLEETGALSFALLWPADDEVPDLVARMRAVEDRAWQGRQGTGLFSTAARRAFFGRALAALAAEGRVGVQIMQLDGEDVMYLLGLGHGGVFCWYSTAHLPGRITGSAFTVLLHELLPALGRRGVTLLDSSRNTPGTQTPLDRLPHRRLSHRHLIVYRPTLPGALHRRVLTGLKPLYRRLRARLAGRLGGGPARAGAWVAEPADALFTDEE